MRRRPAALLLLALLALAAGIGPHPCAPAPPQAESAGSCHGSGDSDATWVGAGDLAGAGGCCALDDAGACAAVCGMPSWLAVRDAAPDSAGGRLVPLPSPAGPRGCGAPRDPIPLA
jgi:hypothetical protein